MSFPGLAATDEMQVQVLVVGGGLAGTCAAIAAARKGVSVALVQERPVLGGNSSSEIRVGPVGASQSGYHRDARESGIIEEIFLEVRARAYGLKQFNGNHYPFWDVILGEKAEAEPNLELLLNTRVVGVRTSDIADGDYERRVDGVWAIQQGTEKVFNISCDMAIDATGDGFIAFQAGAPFRYGREAKAEFGESWAPDEADDIVLGSSIMFAARDVGRPVPFVAPDWAHTFPDEESLPYRTHENFDAGYWWIEWGGTTNTIKNNEEIRQELQSAVLGVWDHIKNHCTVPGVRERAATWTLDWIGHMPGKRESRRFEGDHILTEHDVVAGLYDVPDDVITHGGWPIDLHVPDGIYSSDKPCTQPPLPGLYGIPLSTLYSRTVSNLFLAGRDISTTHVAHGTTRVMKTGAVIGEAAGVAAAKAIQADLTPRALRQDTTRLRELQKSILRDGLYLPLLSIPDEADLAQRPDVKVTASSEASLILGDDQRWEEAGTGFPEHKGTQGIRQVSLDRKVGQAFLMSEDALEGIALDLVSDNAGDVTVQLSIRQAAQLRDFGPCEAEDQTLAVLEATVPPGQSTVKFKPRERIACTPNRPLVLVVEPVEGVSWVLSAQEPPGTQAGHWDEDLGYWRWFHGTLAFASTPVSTPYGPSNILTGINRPEQATNLWVSNPAESLPQSISLTWDEPVDIGTVEVTFDSNLSGWVWEGPFPTVVRDYDITVDGKCVVQINDNHQRRGVHAVEGSGIRTLTLTVSRTQGSATARVVEIRAYPPE